MIQNIFKWLLPPNCSFFSEIQNIVKFKFLNLKIVPAKCNMKISKNTHPPWFHYFLFKITLFLLYFLFQMAGANQTVRIYKCDICQKEFSKINCLKRHIRYNHGKDGGEKCQFCSCECRNMSNCKRHEDVVHKGIKKYICETCDDSFTTRYQLLGHKRAHHTTSKLQCASCNKNFTLHGNLTQHESICQKKQDLCRAKTFQCKQCEKTFRTQRYLQAHTKVAHTEALKCICDICWEEFSCQFSLRHHSNRKH